MCKLVVGVDMEMEHLASHFSRCSISPLAVECALTMDAFSISNLLELGVESYENLF